MKCVDFQNLCLSAEYPADLPIIGRDHLGQCPQCQSFHLKLLAVEKQLSQMECSAPVLSPLERWQKVGNRLEVPFSPPIAPLLRFRKPGIERGRKKLALAVALIAFLLTMAGGLFFWPKPIDRSTLAGLRAERDLHLKRSKTSSAKLDSLFFLARQSETEAQGLAANGDNKRLELLAHFYGELLNQDLDKVLAKTVTFSRDQILTLVNDRTRAESDLLRLAAESAHQPEVEKALKQMAQAANVASQKLRQVIA